MEQCREALFEGAFHRVEKVASRGEREVLKRILSHARPNIGTDVKNRGIEGVVREAPLDFEVMIPTAEIASLLTHVIPDCLWQVVARKELDH